MWVGCCHQLALAALEAGAPGRVIAGRWVGPIHPASAWIRSGCHLFSEDGGPPRHSWVLLDDGRVLDPTRWCFEGSPARLYVGPADYYLSAPTTSGGGEE